MLPDPHATNMLLDPSHPDATSLLPRAHPSLYHKSVSLQCGTDSQVATPRTNLPECPPQRRRHPCISGRPSGRGSINNREEASVSPVCQAARNVLSFRTSGLEFTFVHVSKCVGFGALYGTNPRLSRSKGGVGLLLLSTTRSLYLFCEPKWGFPKIGVPFLGS